VELVDVDPMACPSEQFQDQRDNNKQQVDARGASSNVSCERIQYIFLFFRRDGFYGRSPAGLHGSALE
jgi:hypothetical protein